MKRLSHALFSLVLLLHLQAPGRVGAIETSDPICTIPPDNAIDTVTSDDLKYLPMWMNDSAVFDDLWGGLESDADDWDDGWGWSDRNNLDRMLPRLINSAQLIWMVEQYTKHPGFGFWRPVSDAPGNLPVQGEWWDFMTTFAEDEWEPGCSSDTANAAHFTVPFDEFNTLQLNGAYTISVISRASSMVHEIVHQDVDHLIFDDNCNPPTESCDDVYGTYNSNTIHINFLDDAAAAFQTQDIGGALIRRVSVSADNETCSWLPLFDSNEITSAVTRSSQVAARFEKNAYSGWRNALAQEVTNRQAAGTWACETCDPNDWIWSNVRSRCDQIACNESVNSANAFVNATNATACNDYNTAVAASTGPESVGIARELQNQQTKPCLPASEADARRYCDSEKSFAKDVREIDTCGWLDSVHFPSVSKVGCIKEYCHEEYNVPEEVPFDWSGCLDYFCGETSSCSTGEDFGTCSDWFKLVKGDPEYYVDGCEWNRCKQTKVQCLKEAHAAGTWNYGDPIPIQCSSAEQLCRLMSRLAVEVFVSLEPFLERPPMADLFEGVGNLNPGKNVYKFAEQLRQAALDGDSATVDAMALELTSSSEMIAALFNVAPEQFVGLFGKEGFETLLGPKLDSITGQAIRPEQLTPAGRAAFDQLQEQLELVGGSYKGAIGTLNYAH